MPSLTCVSLAAEMERLENETVISDAPCGAAPDYSVSGAIYESPAKQAAELKSRGSRVNFFKSKPDACEHLGSGNAQRIETGDDFTNKIVGFGSRGCHDVAQRIRMQRTFMNAVRPEDDVDGAILEREIVVVRETLRRAPVGCPFLTLEEFLKENGK